MPASAVIPKIWSCKLKNYSRLVAKKCIANQSAEKIITVLGPELMTMIESLRKNDTVVVYKIDRIARSLNGLIDIVESLNTKKVNFISLDSGDKVDTTSPMGRAFFQIAGVFAELERGMINARTKAGIKKARSDGVKFGRIRGSKNKTTPDKHEKIKIFLQAGKCYDWITKELCVSKKTIAEVKKSMAIKQDF